MIKMFGNVCWAESLKLRRSRAPLMTALALAMAPVAAALLMLAGTDSDRAGLPSLVTLESQMAWLRADWPGYFRALAGATAVGGLIVFGLFMIWIFGREHADRTFKELLTLPVPREMLVGGKILVAAAWCAVLQAGMLGIALFLGACLRLPSWSFEALLEGLAKNFSVAALTICLAIPFGLLANLRRGTMAAVGVLFMSLFFAVIMTAIGWGAYFPWSIPALYGGAAEGAGSLGHYSLCLVIATGLTGIFGSMIWSRLADQR